MNKSKWKKEPIPKLALKLAEETGEVAKEVTNALTSDGFKVSPNVLTELDHVIFIATTMYDRLKPILSEGDR